MSTAIQDLANFAVLSLNFEAMRKSAPDAYKQVADEIANLPQMIGDLFGGLDYAAVAQRIRRIKSKKGEKFLSEMLNV